MASKQWATTLSSSGRVQCAINNHVAFLNKEAVHADFHPLMDFLKKSPVSYALTASPTIYAEIVQEMWSTACSSEGQIKIRIKGNSYVITPSVINEALHFPNSNFESLPTNEEVRCMLSSTDYYTSETSLCEKYLRKLSRRKEWSYFFDTLTRVFTSKYGGYDDITKNVQKIAYSLMYGRAIDIGSLLLSEISEKLGNKGNRRKVIYYARFLMIIANHLCKELAIKDRDDTLQVCAQTEGLFTYLVKKDDNHNVKFVLPEHIQAQLSNSSSSHSQPTSSPFHDTKEVRKDSVLSTKKTLHSKSPPSKNATSSRYCKRKLTDFSTTIAGRSEGNEEATEVNPTKKKMEESIVKPQTGQLDVDPQMPPGSSGDGVLVADLPSSVQEKPKSLRFVLEHTPEPDCPEEDISQDRQHLVNQHLVKTASVLKSQLVACLTSSADKLSHNDMTNLANRSFTALRAFGDDFTSFSREVNKLIERRRVLEYAVKKKEKNDRDRKARYIQKEMSLSLVSEELSGAQEKLFTAETYVESLMRKREELTVALLEITEELSEEKKRVENLVAERDQCVEARSDIEAELSKLKAEKEEACAEFEAINAQYNAAKDELERTNNQLLKLVCK